MPSSPPLNQNGDADADFSEIENQVGDAYNNVNLSGGGTNLEFFTPNGGTTAVKSITLPSGSGSGSTFEAFNSVSELNGVYTFGTNHGNSIGTTIDIGGITTNSASISGLSSTVTGHTTAIDDVEAAIETQVGIEVPFDFPEFDMTSNTTTVNGVTYIASGSNSNPWKGFSAPSNQYYESSFYETLIGTRFDYGGSEGHSGSYDYAGTENLGTGAVDGSWLKLQLPEPRAVSGFKIRNFDNEEDCVLGWNIYASSNDSDWTLLGSYLTNHKNKPTHGAGGNTYELDSTLAGYGQLYSYYAIVFTRVFGGEFPNKAKAKLRELRLIGGTRLAAHVGAVIRTNNLNISTLEQRDKFKDIHEHPDLHDECYLAHLHDNNKSLTVNGRTYTFTSSSHIEYRPHYEYYAFMEVTGELWESDGNTYNTVDAGGYYRNYSGSASLGGISGEWLQVKLPEPILLNSFKLRSCPVADGGMPRSFTIIASTDGTNYDTIQSYSDVSVSNTAETLFQINSTASNYGNKYSYYAIVITKIDPNPWGTVHFKSVQIRRWRLFSVNDDVAECIKKTDESFNTATITGTNTLNLISDSGTTSLTLPGGTTAATSVDAITINIDINGSASYYTIQGVADMPLELLYGHKYIFNYPSLHPLKFSTTEDGTHNGGTEDTNGRTDTITTPAAAVGVFWQFEFINVSQGHLYYYCSSHSGMGGHIFAQNGKNNIKRNGFTYDTSVSPPKIIIERENELTSHTQELNLSDSFVQAQKDGDNIKLTTISGAQTTVGPFSGGGPALSTTNYPTSALTTNSGFSATPPATITLTGVWGSAAYNHQLLSHTTESAVYHMVNTTNNVPFGGYGIVFTILSNQLRLYVNDGTVGLSEPSSFTINGNAASEGDAVTGNDTIALVLGNGNVTDTFTVPTELIPSTITTSASSEYNPAYHAFDEDLTTEWISQSNRYDVTTGNPVQTTLEFPEIALTSATDRGHVVTVSSTHAGGAGYMAFNKILTPGSDYWMCTPTGLYSSGTYTGSSSLGGEDGEWITIEFPYYVRPSNLHMTARDNDGYDNRPNAPKDFKVFGSNDGSTWTEILSATGANIQDLTNGGGSSFTPHTIANYYKILALVVSATNGGSRLSIADITYSGKKRLLSPSVSDGESLKISLDSSVEATTLTLKSISEYVEPRINMTASNQYGYEATASSENTGSWAYYVFDKIRTGTPNLWDFTWRCASVYNTSGTYAGSSNLGTGVPNGEWLKLKMPDKRKIVAYELSRSDGTDYSHAPQEFHLYASNDNSTWVLLDSQTRGSTDPINSKTQSPNANATAGSRFDLSSVSIAYQYVALVVEKTHSSIFCLLHEFQLVCEPSEIEEFKLYGSPDNSSWTEIHAQTAANITSSGVEFQITSPGSYQHYGLVITKNYGYHDVSLAEMKLLASDTVDLSNYYNKGQVDSLLPKGVWAEASVVYTSNSSSSYSASQLAVSAVGGQHEVSPGVLMGTLATSYWNGPLWWSSAPEAHRWAFTHYFDTPYVDDTNEASSEYKVVLTKTNITMFDIFVIQKQPTYCVIGFYTTVNPMNYHINDFSYDIMVF